MATQNSINLPVTVNADGFTISGGTTERDLTVTGADVTLTGGGGYTYTLPAATCTLLGSGDVGIANDKVLTVDDAAAVNDDYAKFTDSGIEGVPYATVLTDIGACPITHNADGFTIHGGTTDRDLTVTGTDITITGSGSNVYTFPASTCTLSAANPLATDSLWDAKGDLVVGSGANTAARLAVGTDNYYLKVATDTAAWEALDISDDASPTLGGNLACGGYTLTGAGHGIADNQVLTVDDAAAADNDVAIFTANGIEGVSMASTLSLLLANPMAENDMVLFDAALSADGKYCGIGETGTGGAVIAFGSMVYFNSAGKWVVTDADAEATASGRLGMCVVACGGDTQTITVLNIGKVREDDWNWATVGAKLFLDTATAGGLTETAPSAVDDVVRVAGWVIDANTAFIWPSPDCAVIV